MAATAERQVAAPAARRAAHVIHALEVRALQRHAPRHEVSTEQSKLFLSQCFSPSLFPSLFLYMLVCVVRSHRLFCATQKLTCKGRGMGRGMD